MGIKFNTALRFSVTAIIGIQWIIISGSVAFAQDLLKEMRSNVIEKINGKDYYIHTIKKGQTLYMISKAYGADVNEVIRVNPEVKEGIKADQKIRIPVPETEGSGKKIVKPTPPKAKESTVPSTKTEPPTKTEPLPKTEPVVESEPVPHPELPCGQDKEAKRDLYHVALMLPLYLNETDQIITENPPDDPEAEYQSLRFLQFYEGSRIAMDSLQKSGIKVIVNIYDVGKDTNTTRRLLRNPDLKKMDLIIGLLFHRNFQMVSGFAQKNNIPVVNPMSEREEIVTGNPMVFKARPSIKTQIPDLTKYLSDAYPGENIIIIRDIQFKDKESPEELLKACTGKQMQSHLVDGYGKALELLSREKENILVVFSDNKVFTIELFTKLNEFRNEYKLTIFGMPDWDEMEGLEPEYLVNLNTHMMSTSFIDYEDPDVKRFVMQFQEKYKTDPAPLAFQGFDITYYFFSALYYYGKALEHCIPELRMKSLQNDFRFVQSPGNGYENKHWDIYKFENYKMVRLDGE